MPLQYALAIHIGAGMHSVTKTNQYLSLMESILKDIQLKMKSIKSEDWDESIVAETISRLENAPITNAGTGSNLTRFKKRVECDACIMKSNGQWASVGAARGIKNPIKGALWLMKQEHEFLVEPIMLTGLGLWRKIISETPSHLLIDVEDDEKDTHEIGKVDKVKDVDGVNDIHILDIIDSIDAKNKFDSNNVKIKKDLKYENVITHNTQVGTSKINDEDIDIINNIDNLDLIEYINENNGESSDNHFITSVSNSMNSNTDRFTDDIKNISIIHPRNNDSILNFDHASSSHYSKNGQILKNLNQQLENFDKSLNENILNHSKPYLPKSIKNINNDKEIKNIKSVKIQIKDDNYLEICKNKNEIDKYLIHESALKRWNQTQEMLYDTVGAVLMIWDDGTDTESVTATDGRKRRKIHIESNNEMNVAGVSSGGIIWKSEGRVGEAAIAGSGCYASKSCAISCTGCGEDIMLSSTASSLAQALQKDQSNYDAFEEILINNHISRQDFQKTIKHSFAQPRNLVGALALQRESDSEGKDKVKLLYGYTAWSMGIGFISSYSDNVCVSIERQEEASVGEDLDFHEILIQ